MTYVLLSFTIDIAVRSVELAVLEILSPIFIITFVDPKSASTGPFSKWLKACSKSYLSLFIKVAVVSLMLLLISNLDSLLEQTTSTSGGSEGLMKLLMLVAILIFAKKAPKWLGDMFGLADGAGLGGLGIGKKLGQAALVGGALQTGTKMATGAPFGIGRTIHNNHKNRKAAKKEARKETGYKRTPWSRNKQYEDYARKAAQNLDEPVMDKKSYYKDKKKEYNKALKEKHADTASYAKQVGASIIMGAVEGAKVSAKADGLSGIFKASVKAADDFSKNMGMQDKGILSKVRSKVQRLPGMIEGAWGTRTERYDRVQDAEKNKKVAGWTEQTGTTLTAGVGENQIAASQGKFNQLISSISSKGGQIGTYEDALAAQYAVATGHKVEDVAKMRLDSDGVYKIDGKAIIEKSNLKTEDGKVTLGGLVDPASSYGLESEKMYNKFQTDCMNNYLQNQQTAAQANATLANASAQSLAIEANARTMADSLSVALGAAFSTLKIEGIKDPNGAPTIQNLSDNVARSLKELEKLNEASDAWENMSEKDKQTAEANSNAEPETLDSDTSRLVYAYNAHKNSDLIKTTIQQLTPLSTQLETKAVFDKQIEENKVLLAEIQEAQKELGVIRANIKGATDSAKMQELSINSSRIESALKAFEAKEKKN